MKRMSPRDGSGAEEPGKAGVAPTASLNGMLFIGTRFSNFYTAVETPAVAV